MLAAPFTLFSLLHHKRKVLWLVILLNVFISENSSRYDLKSGSVKSQDILIRLTTSNQDGYSVYRRSSQINITVMYSKKTTQGKTWFTIYIIV
jgi:hypothetical protein